jgi:hypothetical protein
MDVLQGEVGRDQSLVTPWNSENGTVIPNANSVIQGSATLFGFPAYAGYQSFFMEGQSAINITRAAGARVGNNCLGAGR